ncbi:hypothetical protein HPB49_008892 [Dermacentor silvarum]|uniref:Uncharacterized protein n=1 Tax=Dermacentor silvarum TaxID=543639 RepID=A0ACB8C2P8_DERSI|nr:hypothetical protein HPB49_008892 [Dermacentor silvarum]
MTSHTNEITVEHRNANSTRPGTRPVSEVDAKVDAAGSASLTATPLMTTSLEGNMEHEDDDTSDCSPVNYRRYTTRRLKGELRSEWVSRPHFFVLVRPLNQMSIEEVPKSTITPLIGQTAPTSVAAEHSAFRYIPKANAVRLSIWDQQLLNNLLAQRELTLTPGTSGEAHRIPVEIVDATQPAAVTSKRVVKIRPEHTEEYIANHIRCESANILGFRIMGKTQMLMVTFDTPHPPRRLSLDYEIVPVYEHRPRAFACFRYHGLGHMAKFCPWPAVCRHCGRTHKEDSQCEETPFCVACQAAGHISLAPNCPTRACKAASSPPPKKSPATEIERGEQELPLVNSTGTPLKTWSQVMTSNRVKSNGKGEDKTERFEQVQAVSAGAWSKFQQQMENLIQQKLDAMQTRSHLGYKPPKDNTRKQQSTHHNSQKLQSQLLQHPLRNPTPLPNTETQCASQNSPASLERKSPVTVDRAMDTIMQLLEKLNSRMEAIERAIEQQEQVIMQHKEVNEWELAQHKATLDEYNRNWRRSRNRSRD